MRRSDTIAELAKALSTFQGVMKSVPKGSKNPFFHSKYADLDAIWEACRKPLVDNGLTLVQTTSEEEGRIFLDTTLLHTSGEYIGGQYPITPMHQVKDVGWVLSDDPQSLGSAITYARRYAMSAILGVSAEDDDDGERSMNRDRQPTAARVPRPPQGTSSAPQSEAPAPSPVDFPKNTTTPPILTHVGELMEAVKARWPDLHRTPNEICNILGVESIAQIREKYANLSEAWKKIEKAKGA